MKISIEGLAVLKRLEGAVKVDGRHVPYDDATGEPIEQGGPVIGNPTIGHGHLITGAIPWRGWTNAQAAQQLDTDLDEAEGAVSRLVTVALTQPQFDALVSIAFNMGEANFRRTRLLTLVNKDRFAAAGKAFMRYTKGRVGGKLIHIDGLVRRRRAERRLFESQYTGLPGMKRTDLAKSKHIKVGTTATTIGGATAAVSTAASLFDDLSPILDWMKSNTTALLIGLGLLVAVGGFLIIRWRMQHDDDGAR